MSETIYKYEIQITDEQDISMPIGAELLHVDRKYGVYMIWARVNTSNVIVDRRIKIRGTGHPLDGTEGKHIGTVLDPGAPLVWHFFDGGESHR